MEGKHNTEQAVARIRWIYLAVSAVGLFFVGILYAWSILKVPFSEEFGWEPSCLALNYTITMCFFCLGSLVSGILTRRVSVKALLAVSGSLILAGYFLVSRLTGESVGMLYLSYGVIFGTGVGIGYNSLLSTGNAWFPDKKGTSSGILMMCFGFSTMILGRTASSMFHMAQFGWRKTFLLLGVAVLAVLLVCAGILKRPDPDTVLPRKKSGRKTRGEDFEQRDYTTAETIRRPAFWMFYLYGTLAATVGSAVISFARELSMSLGAEAALATTLVGVLSVCNGLGRILCGMTFDRLGRRYTMLLVSVVTLVAPAVMLAAI